MADYVFIDNLTNTGKIGISYMALESLVSDVISEMPGISKSSKYSETKFFRLFRPVQVDIRNGVVHVWVAIEIDEKVDEPKIVKLLEEEIHNALYTATEQVPHEIEIKVERKVAKNEAKKK